MNALRYKNFSPRFKGLFKNELRKLNLMIIFQNCPLIPGFPKKFLQIEYNILCEDFELKAAHFTCFFKKDSWFASSNILSIFEQIPYIWPSVKIFGEICSYQNSWKTCRTSNSVETPLWLHEGPATAGISSLLPKVRVRVESIDNRVKQNRHQN